MSLECRECERDLRGGHDRSCSRWMWFPNRGERVTHADFGEGVVDWVDEDGSVRVKYPDVTAWSDWKNLAQAPQDAGVAP